MSLLAVVGIILLAGLLIWVIGQLPFIDPSMKKVATIVIVVAVALWIISLFFGVDLGSVHLGHVR
jgi:preprotein translocase subunit SecE